MVKVVCVLISIIGFIIVCLLIWSSLPSVFILTFSEVELLSLSFESVASGVLFSLLVLVVSVVVFSYASYYINSEFSFGFYIGLITIFIVSILGLLVTSSWTVLVLSWEGLGITSFFLVNYYQAWESQSNALVTLLTIRLGDLLLFLVVGIVVLISNLGMVTAEVKVVEGAWLVLIALTKSAQVPFSGWLPKAISAPTPTSALVHSSTLVTAGLVLLISYSELISSSVSLALLVWCGWFTMVAGSLIALGEGSIKRIIAYSTLSQVGIGAIVYGLGCFTLGYYNLIAHGVAKSLLFLQVGYLIHCSYSQQGVRFWSSTGQVEGWLCLQLIVSLISLCGISFTSGIASKEALLVIFSNNTLGCILILGITISVYLTVGYSVSIYQCLSISSCSPILFGGVSVTVLMSTGLEALLAVCYFSWLLSNSVHIPHFTSYVEVYSPLLVFLVVITFVIILSTGAVNYSSLRSGSYLVGGLAHYKWVQVGILNFKWLEALFYSMHALIYLTSVIVSVSLGRLSVNRSSLLLLIVAVLLLW